MGCDALCSGGRCKISHSLLLARRACFGISSVYPQHVPCSSPNTPSFVVLGMMGRNVTLRDQAYWRRRVGPGINYADQIDKEKKKEKEKEKEANACASHQPHFGTPRNYTPNRSVWWWLL